MTADRRASSRTRAAVLTGLAASVLAGACTPESTRLEPTASSVGTTPSPGAEPAYRDGDYRAEGWYGSLPSHIVVDVRLHQDRIEDVVVTPTATDPTSLDLQERFAEAVVDEVVGRPIAEIELDYLAGSSGTTLGFNDALARIMEQAER